MLTLTGQRLRMCDGLSRRSFLQVGGLAMGGLSLPQILRAQDAAGESSQHKAVIMIFLAGGFDPIETSVPGIQISELMPRVASMMDRFAIIRSLTGAEGRHDAFECCTGHHFRSNQPQGGWPAMGSSLSRLMGPVDPSVPPYVDLSHKMAHDPWNIKGPGFLGMNHAPFRPDGESMQNITLRDISGDRFNGRTSLLTD
ncbi:MAG: DUF1501 domain-containing protein, partial [Planctomycetota bacterium]